jgi:hypothetical protein
MDLHISDAQCLAAIDIGAHNVSLREDVFRDLVAQVEGVWGFQVCSEWMERPTIAELNGAVELALRDKGHKIVS